MTDGPCALHPLLVDNIEAIRALCRAYRVERLDVFGSFCTESFDPRSSDIDFLVFYPDGYDLGPLYRRFFAFQRALTHLLGCAVELVEARAMRDPLFAREANKTRSVVYDASDVAEIAS